MSSEWHGVEGRAKVVRDEEALQELFVDPVVAQIRIGDRLTDRPADSTTAAMAKDARGASELRRQEKVGDPQFADVAKASPTRFSVPVRGR